MEFNRRCPPLSSSFLPSRRLAQAVQTNSVCVIEKLTKVEIWTEFLSQSVCGFEGCNLCYSVMLLEDIEYEVV